MFCSRSATNKNAGLTSRRRSPPWVSSSNDSYSRRSRLNSRTRCWWGRGMGKHQSGIGRLRFILFWGLRVLDISHQSSCSWKPEPALSPLVCSSDSIGKVGHAAVRTGINTLKIALQFIATLASMRSTIAAPSLSSGTQNFGGHLQHHFVVREIFLELSLSGSSPYGVILSWRAKPEHRKFRCVPRQWRAWIDAMTTYPQMSIRQKPARPPGLYALRLSLH